MNQIKNVLVLLLALVMTTTVVLPAQKQKPPKQPSLSWVEATLASMTLDEKIGQLIIPATVGMFMTESSDTFQEIHRDLTQFHVGGYHMLGDVTMLHEPSGVALLINQLQKRAKVPLFITADFEGGVGYRFTGATRLPRAMVMGATYNEESAYQAGRIAGEEARAIGVNVNFYPVVDVNNNARNPVINIRSFGADPDLVARMGRAYIRGLQSANVMATAKHFPGHGDTSTDSHLELPVVDIPIERLNKIELPPFRAAVQEGVGGVMSAHIALPQILRDKLPATLSSRMLTDTLRVDMGFKGIIFTDAMNMRGVAAHYPEGEAAVLALKAGADVILYPPSVEKAFTAMKRAVQTGDIKEARVEESVRRILAAKLKLGLDKQRFVDLEKIPQALGSKANREAAQQIADRAVTLVRDDKKVLPVKLTPEKQVLCLTLTDGGDSVFQYAPGRVFTNGLLQRHRQVATVAVTPRTSPAEYELIRRLAAFSDLVIINGFIRAAAFKGSIDLNENQMELLKSLSRGTRPFVFVMYGSPYLLTFVPELPTYILAYEYYAGVEEAALKAVLGEIPFQGRLPIELPGLYEIGHAVK